jgi:microcystin degradation protein MlrC
VGGKLDRKYNRPYTFTGALLRKTRTAYGDTAVLKFKGVRLVLVELATASEHPEFYAGLGLSPWKADIIVVKSVFHYRLYYMLYNRKTIYVDTPGTTSYDVFKLGYKNIPRPIYPLDKDIASWRMRPRGTY